MRPFFVSITLSLALAGCASTDAGKPPVCDGKYRRPVNLYGSVLMPAAADDRSAVSPAAKPEMLSAIPQPPSGSCRA